MKIKTFVFYFLIACYTVFLILLFFKVIRVDLDVYSTLILFAFIGISLIPFADKLKIGNVLEFERLKEKIEKVEENQFLGQVLEAKNGILYFFDSDGLHKIPDKETGEFLTTHKGVIKISDSELKLLRSSYEMESVLKAQILDWHGHIFVVLNKKKYHITSWAYVADWGRDKDEARKVESSEIRGMNTGK
jgi:hypothetical protein